MSIIPKTKTDPHTSQLRLFARRFVRRVNRSASWLLRSVVEVVKVMPEVLGELFFGPPRKPLGITVPHILLGTFVRFRAFTERDRLVDALAVATHGGEKASQQIPDNSIDPVPCYLTFGDLNTHLHGKGLTRTGKSKLIEHICRELLIENQGFTLIDPNGELFWQVGAYLASKGIPAYLMNPSDTDRLVGFNPLVSTSKDEAALYTKADRMKKATLMTWGVDDDTQTPRLARLLRAVYYTFLEQDLSIVAIEHFLNPNHEAQRQAIIN